MARAVITHRSPLLQLVLVMGLGCADPRADVTGSDPTAAPISDAGNGLARVRCTSPAGTPAAPRNIAEVVDLLNALPKPVTLPCFIDSLARPLAMQAANSVFSAQPAVGRRSPRMFLFFDPLVLSIVPAGDGAQLLEFGERRDDKRSLKAELEFPITHELDAAAPYERLPFNDSISTCGFCHQGEVAAADIALPFAMVSPALRPLREQRIPLTELQGELSACDPAAEPERCEMLDALFGRDPWPVEREFPEAFATFL